MLQTDNVELLTLHLFSGAGGGLLADEMLGFRPIGAVECDDYCRRVLLNRQADGQLPQFPVWDDVRTFRADNPATRDYIDRLRQERDRLCICGGFPCQDISAAGRKAGITGARSGLWKEYARIVSEIRPAYVYVENSPMLIRYGLDVVSADVAAMGYSFTWGVISAAETGAPHKRERFWGLAISDSVCVRDTRRLWRDCMDKIDESFNARRKTAASKRQWKRRQPRLGGVADGLDDWLDEVTAGRFWDVQEHGLPRLAEQCDNRRQRLRAIGNGQVPLCAAVAFVTLLKQYITLSDNG